MSFFGAFLHEHRHQHNLVQDAAFRRHLACGGQTLEFPFECVELFPEGLFVDGGHNRRPNPTGLCRLPGLDRHHGQTLLLHIATHLFKFHLYIPITFVFIHLDVREELNFILVCKPDSHQTLYEWVAGLEATGDVQTLEVKRRKGKKRYTDTYRFVNQVPLRDGEGALDVNWCELTTTRDDSKVVYKNAFATHHQITKANVVEIVRAGRARWKVENENNNTLKTKGLSWRHRTPDSRAVLSTNLRFPNTAPAPSSPQVRRLWRFCQGFDPLLSLVTVLLPFS